MRYCCRCVLPETRPNLEIDAEGVCNACRAHGTKQEIDWTARAKAFDAVVAHAKANSQSYDCIIPVSGGKDSTWQVVKCLEYGLKPLAVTWKPPARTAIGQANLNNLIRLGVDHIDYSINPDVEKRFLYQALKRYGSTAIPMHMAMFNIPLTIAVRFSIPLVVWGENSAFEYGGTAEERTGFRLDERWLKKYGVTHGTTARDWVGTGLDERDLAAYFGPSPSEVATQGVNAVFLGCYFAWDPQETLRVACKHGFQARVEGPKTGYYNYADIDDDFISLHHYLKWYKFGFTRTWDNLSLEIRNGRMTRKQAIAWLVQRGDETPYEDISAFCRFVGISEGHFFELIEPFRNRAIWCQTNGIWRIPDFLIPNWEWREHEIPADRSAARV
jgi:N-acetyl sugar amidotransferase